MPKSTKPKSVCPDCGGEFVSVGTHRGLKHPEISGHIWRKQNHPELYLTNPEPIRWTDTNGKIFCVCVGCRPPTQPPQ